VHSQRFVDEAIQATFFLVFSVISESTE